MARFSLACVLGLSALGLAADARADLVTLYSGTGRPSDQPWLVFAASPLGLKTETVLGSGGIRLETDNTAQAGYSNYVPAIPPSTPFLKNAAFPTLDRTKGFELSFTVAIVSESHSNNNRAGFSVILLGSDARGIELGFWTNRIWAQNQGFTQGESTNIDTTLDRSYQLQVVGNDYALREGSATLLSGSVRDYALFGTPYNLANYLFVGDDTTSAAANVRLGAMVLQSDLSSVPEPCSAMLAGMIVCGIAVRRRAKRLANHNPKRARGLGIEPGTVPFVPGTARSAAIAQ